MTEGRKTAKTRLKVDSTFMTYLRDITFKTVYKPQEMVAA